MSEIVMPMEPPDQLFAPITLVTLYLPAARTTPPSTSTMPETRLIKLAQQPRGRPSVTWTNVPRGHHVVPRGAEDSGEEVFSRRSCLVDHEGGGWPASSHGTTVNVHSMPV